MARLPYLTKADLKEEDQEIVARNMNLHRLLVHSPGAARAVGVLAKYIRFESTLDPRLRELAILQVGWLAKSPYEWAHHIEIGNRFGVSNDDIRALIAETNDDDSGLPERDRLVLRAAREINRDGAASTETFAALGGHLSSEHLVDLTMTVSFYCGIVRFLATMELDVEDNFRHYLDAFPFPM